MDAFTMPLIEAYALAAMAWVIGVLCGIAVMLLYNREI